jgi:hypothetical protein
MFFGEGGIGTQGQKYLTKNGVETMGQPNQKITQQIVPDEYFWGNSNHSEFSRGQEAPTHLLTACLLRLDIRKPRCGSAPCAM